MPSSPTFKNLDALIEQPDSGSLESDGKVTLTKIYMAKYSVCVANAKYKGTLGTGDLAGFVLNKSSVISIRGEIAKLVDVWEAGGPDANPEVTPLPEDSVSLQSQDLNPSVEKNINFQHCVADQTNYVLSGGVKAIARSNAQSSVDRAIERGVIPAQNETLKARWLNLCENDPSCIELLDGAMGMPALTCGRITKPYSR